MIEKRNNMAPNHLTTKKPNFRIRRNKGVKKRLFSASGRDSHRQNVVVQSFRHKPSGTDKEMKVSHNLPPLNPLAVTKFKETTGPFRSNPEIGVGDIENMRGAMYKSKTLVKKKKKIKTRRLSDASEMPPSTQKLPHPRGKSNDGRKLLRTAKKELGPNNLNLPVQEITFKHGGLSSSVFRPIKNTTSSRPLNKFKAKIPNKTITNFKWNGVYSSKFVL
jgi:hypothetical protein